MQNNKYDIKIKVQTHYIEDQSDPEQNRYVFSYTINIENRGEIAATLKSRHWIITDGHGKSHEVKGLGVVGEQPHITPGENYQYSSGTVMESPVGSMHGTYTMIADDKTEFKADIPSFTLSIPHSLH